MDESEWLKARLFEVVEGGCGGTMFDARASSALAIALLDIGQMLREGIYFGDTLIIAKQPSKDDD